MSVGLSLWEEEAPPYVRPTMAEIKATPWNGLTCVGSFSGCGGSSLGLRIAGWRVPYAIEFVPAAADTYEANSDAYVDRRDIHKIEAEEILERLGLSVGELDLYEGSPPCFPAGTLILTEFGQRPIEEVNVNDSVLTHEGRWRRVTETHRRRYYGRLLSLTMKYRSDSEPIRCTTDHPFLVRQRLPGEPRRLSDPLWLAASEIRPHDMLLVPSVKTAPLAPRFDVENVEGRRDWHSEGIATRILVRRANRLDVSSLPVARVLGLYLAEGWRRGYEPDPERPRATRREVIFAAAPPEVAATEALMYDVSLPPATVVQEGQTARKVHVTSIDLWTICGDFGDGAAHKRVPEWIFGMPQEWREAFLREYVRGDGHVTSVGRYLVSSVSRELATGISRLVQETYGVVTSLKRRVSPPWSIDGRSGESRDAWIVGWNPNSGTTGRTAALVDDWGAWLPVQRIEDGGPAEMVYNLGVDEDQSYVAATFAAHNCSSFSPAGNREKGWNKEKKYSDTRQRTDDLFWQYIRALQGLRPRAFIAENVPGLIMGGAVEEYAHKISRDLASVGYRVDARVLNASHYGVPQDRRRLIFVGFREDEGIRPDLGSIPHLPRVTLAQALEAVGSQDPEALAEVSMERFAVGRTWHYMKENGLYGGGGNHKGIAPECGRCGKRIDTGEHSDVIATTSGFIKSAVCEDGEKALITKMYSLLTLPEMDRPCPTITATGSQLGAASVVHPTECRKFTTAEAKSISSFPADFVLTGTREQMYERVGRAVPPLFMAAIGRYVRDSLS